MLNFTNYENWYPLIKVLQLWLNSWPDRGRKPGKATCLGEKTLNKLGRSTLISPERQLTQEDGNLNNKTLGPPSWGLSMRLITSSYKTTTYYRNQHKKSTNSRYPWDDGLPRQQYDCTRRKPNSRGLRQEPESHGSKKDH
jgi:hypothetical protein